MLTGAEPHHEKGHWTDEQEAEFNMYGSFLLYSHSSLEKKKKNNGITQAV